MTYKNAKILGIIGLTLTLILAFGVAFAAVGNSGVAEARESYFADEAAEWEDGVFTEYSTGIYWYASGNPIPRRSNPVDKTRPTFIFAHGWKQNEGYKQRDLLSLWFGTNSEFKSAKFAAFEFETEFYQTLINLGYNVGQFYWSQLSDDTLGCDEKIWSSTGSLGMRYFVNDGAGSRVQGDPALNPTKSVAMIFGDAIREKLGDDYAQDLHLAGHSMGGQLVLATGEYLTLQYEAGNTSEHIVPSQVTLLDPYMTPNALSKGAKIDHLNNKAHADDEMVYIADLCADAMETLARHDVAIDSYGTIFYRMYLLLGATKVAELNDRLGRYCAWTYLQSMADKYSGAALHCMSIDYYFSTLYEETIAKDNFGVEVPSAKGTKEHILSLRGLAFTQSLAVNKANPFYMHNSAYTRTNANYEEVDADYTLYKEPRRAEIAPTKAQNLGLIIGLSVAGGAVVVCAVVAIIIIAKKKKA